MRIAISSEGESTFSYIDQRFGRCKYFVIVDLEGKKVKETESVENKGAIQGHGAGIKAAQQIAELNVDSVITGQIGPNAFEILTQFNIKGYHAEGKITDALTDFLDGNLKEITNTAEPHSGLIEKSDKPTKKILFPLLNNKEIDSEISDHFGHAPFFGLYDAKTKKLTITENKLDHVNATKSPVDQIKELFNPTIVFAKGIGARAIDLFNEKGINLKTGPYNKIKEVINNLDKLEDLTESCGHRH